MESFTVYGITDRIREVITKYPDTRKSNKRYSLADTVLSTFSVFFMQCPSFLAHQRLMQESQGRSNAQTLFNIKDIPTDVQIRNILDNIPPSALNPIFRYCFTGLEETGILNAFRVTGEGGKQGDLLVAVDGTGYFSSDTIHCRNCIRKTYDDGHINYSHSILTPSIVSPGKGTVIPLEPEYITSKDGSVKQDCETNAAKRWITTYGSFYSPYGITILGDDLYSREPMCRLLISEKFNFILVTKRESHKYLYDWIDTMEKAGDLKRVTTRNRDGKYHILTKCRFGSDIPLKDGDDALRVHWCDVEVVREKDGKKVYTNAFISNKPITAETVNEFVSFGRSRWKIENEGNNTLKTKGYHFEHNYGHGKTYLSAVLTALILLAYLSHTMMEFTSEAYRLLRQKLPTRQMFFHHLEAITAYVDVKSWDYLFSIMLKGLKKLLTVTIPPG